MTKTTADLIREVEAEQPTTASGAMFKYLKLSMLGVDKAEALKQAGFEETPATTNSTQAPQQEANELMVTASNGATCAPLDEWHRALVKDSTLFAADMLRDLYGTICGGLPEIVLSFAEDSNPYAPILNSQREALEAAMIGFIQTMILADAHEAGQEA